MASPRKIPVYQTVIPYIRVEDPKGFIKWTSQVFGAKKNEIVETEDSFVRHAQIQVDDAIIMMSTARDEWPIDNATFYIYVDDTQKAYYLALSHGA